MIRCRGRNGWFVLGEADVYNVGEERTRPHGDPPITHLSIYSKKTGKQAPIAINGPTSEVVDLLQQMLNRARRNL